MGYSNDNFWKLDKWDKIGIASLIVFFTIFVVLNTFSFGAEVPSDFYKLDYFDVYKDLIFDYTGLVKTSNNANIYKYKLKNGNNYILLNGSYFYNYVLTNTDDISLDYVFTDKVSTVESSGSQIYIYNSDNFDYLYITFYEDNFVDVYTNANGMTDAISSMIDFVSVDAFWSVFNKAIPYILIVVLVAFGIYLITHAIREISKGRDV